MSDRQSNITTIENDYMLTPGKFASFRPTRMYFWLFIILVLVFGTIVGLIIWYNHTYSNLIWNCMNALVERTINLQFDVVNSLTNRITIGTSLGDFVANLYNACGNYDILKEDNTGNDNIVSISFDFVKKAFEYWQANNDYNNQYFSEEFYNNYHMETLPFYLADFHNSIHTDNFYPFKSSTWYMQKAYGFGIDIDNKDNLQISTEKDTNITYYSAEMNHMLLWKTQNVYTRLQLETTPFSEYKDQFMKFLFDNNSKIYALRNTNTESINIKSGYEVFTDYYKYFIIINKIKRDFFAFESDYEYFNYVSTGVVTDDGYTFYKPDEERIEKMKNDILKDYRTRKDNVDYGNVDLQNLKIDDYLKKNLYYNMAISTFCITYIDNLGNEQKIDNIKFKYESGLTFYKAKNVDKQNNN